MEEKKQVQINVAGDAKPAFSNATQITVHDDAVTLQFAYMRPNTEAGQLMAEVILTPKHAIDFQNALDATLKKHFTKHLDND